MNQAILNRFRIFKLDISFFGKIKLFVWSSVAPFSRRLKCPLPAMSLRVYGIHKVYLNDSTDLGTFLEVFLQDEYKIFQPIKNVKIIIDLGANCGYTSIYFSHIFPEAKIIAVEADPTNVKKIKKNIESFNEQIIIEPSAVALQSGTLDFYLNWKTSISGSTIKRDDGAEKITVPAISFTDLEKKYGAFDIVKFDIEGGEWEVVDSSVLSQEPKIFIGEYHEDIVGKKIDYFLIRFRDYSVTKKKISKNRFLVTLVKKDL